MRKGDRKRIALTLFASLVICALVGCAAPTTDASQADESPAATSGAVEAMQQQVNDTVAPTEQSAVADQAGPTVDHSNRVVCIDAGHGGIPDSTLTPTYPGGSQMQAVEPGGTSGVSTGTPEYQTTLDIALKLQQKLEEAGYTVVMCRTDNDVVMSSEQRAEIANQCNAGLFIRIHCDGGVDSSAYGFSTLTPAANEWTYDIYDASAEAAEVMHPVIISELGAADKGIVERSDLAGFNFCDVPAVLFECGFMSNPDEELLLISSEYQDKIAQAICDATGVYFDLQG